MNIKSNYDKMSCPNTFLSILHHPLWHASDKTFLRYLAIRENVDSCLSLKMLVSSEHKWPKWKFKLFPDYPKAMLSLLQKYVTQYIMGWVSLMAGVVVYLLKIPMLSF